MKYPWFNKTLWAAFGLSHELLRCIYYVVLPFMVAVTEGGVLFKRARGGIRR